MIEPTMSAKHAITATIDASGAGNHIARIAAGGIPASVRHINLHYQQ
jgi:hypothetical protein